MKALERLFEAVSAMKADDVEFSAARCMAKHEHGNCLLWKFRGDCDYIMLRDLTLAAMEEN